VRYVSQKESDTDDRLAVDTALGLLGTSATTEAQEHITEWSFPEDREDDPPTCPTDDSESFGMSDTAHGGSCVTIEFMLFNSDGQWAGCNMLVASSALFFNDTDSSLSEEQKTAIVTDYTPAKFKMDLESVVDKVVNSKTITKASVYVTSCGSDKCNTFRTNDKVAASAPAGEWNDDLEDSTSEAYQNLATIMESVLGIMCEQKMAGCVKITLKGFTKAMSASKRQRRSPGDASADFEAEVSPSAGIDANAIASSYNEAKSEHELDTGVDLGFGDLDAADVTVTYTNTNGYAKLLPSVVVLGLALKAVLFLN
jgi:hypothetical protein